jgi:hypothetical protein
MQAVDNAMDSVTATVEADSGMTAYANKVSGALPKELQAQLQEASQAAKELLAAARKHGPDANKEQATAQQTMLDAITGERLAELKIGRAQKDADSASGTLVKETDNLVGAVVRLNTESFLDFWYGGRAQQLAAAQAAAWKLGRERYNWDVEQEILLQSVAAAFSRRDEEPACRQ